MKNTILLTLFVLSLVATGSLQAQDDNTPSWQQLTRAVPAHSYPVRGRFNRTPEGPLDAQLKNLQGAVKAAAGAAAEAPALFYLGNTHFKLNQFTEALAIFKDIQTRFAQHGLCTLPYGNKDHLPAVQSSIADCESEIRIRKFYTPKSLAVATMDPTTKAVIHTNKGSFTLGFYTSAAPETVANFKKLVLNGTINSTYFHRVHPMQSILGGCPNTKSPNRRRQDDGQGALGYDIPVELNTAQHSPGAVSMNELQGSNRAHSCQFTICVSFQPKLNQKQAVFAQVTDGLDVIKRISQERADDQANPYEAVYIQGTEWVEGDSVGSQNPIDGVSK